jgi:hypothetical protein
MKDLKTYFESLLDKTHNKLGIIKDTILDVAKKEFMDKLKSLLNRNPSVKVDDPIFDEVVDFLTEVPSEDMAGKKWSLLLPDEDSNFKPVMVSLKYGIWRYAITKDVCDTTDSAIEKRIKKYVKYITNYNDSLMSTLPGVKLVWFMISYDKVDSFNGSGWVTIPIMDIYDLGGPKIVISINPTKKQWGYGCPTDKIPNEFKVGNYKVKPEWVNFSNVIIGNNFNNQLNKNQFNNVLCHLTHGSVEEYYKSPNDWIQIELHTRFTFGKSNNTDIVYINKNDLSYLTSQELSK